MVREGRRLRGPSSLLDLLEFLEGLYELAIPKRQRWYFVDEEARRFRQVQRVPRNTRRLFSAFCSLVDAHDPAMGASEDAFVYEPLDDDLSPSYPPSQQSASPSRPYFLPLSILSSTLAAFSLAHLALHSQLTVLFALVPAQLLVLVLFAGAEVWWTSRKRHAEAGGCGLDGRWKEISLHGAALALGSFLLIWGARLVHPIVWTGLEVSQAREEGASALTGVAGSSPSCRHFGSRRVLHLKSDAHLPPCTSPRRPVAL